MIRRTRPEERTATAAVADRATGDSRAVRTAAVKLLAGRDFASAALRERLVRQGFEPGLVAAALAELAAERAIDDARYARHFVAHHADRGQGPARITADLAARGVRRELIDAALEEGPDWSALARQVRVRRFGRDPPGSWAERARQARFLQYRGFSSDHIRSALGPDTPDE